MSGGSGWGIYASSFAAGAGPVGPFYNTVQAFTITIPINATSATYTLPTSVTKSRAGLFFAQFTTDNTGTAAREYMPRVELTNNTTVTATRDTASTLYTITVYCTVIDFTAAAVNSVQHGTMTIGSGATSNTATITSVNLANSSIMHLGNTMAINTFTATNLCCNLELTNSTTITANRATTTSIVSSINYCVIEWNPAIIQSVQQRAVTLISSTATDTDTISSVNVNNTILLWGGFTAGNNSFTNALYNVRLTGATSVLLSRGGTNSSTRTIKYTAVEFVSGFLKSNAQTFSKTILSGSSSISQAITSAGAGGVVVSGGVLSIGTSTGSVFSASQLTSSTNVDSVRNFTSSSAGQTYTVFELQ